MKKQKPKRALTFCDIHTLLLLGKDPKRLKAIARLVAAPDRIVMMVGSKQAMRTVFDFERVGLTIVDVDNAEDLSKVIPSLKRRPDMPLVLIREEKASTKRQRKGSRTSAVSTITKPVSPPFLEREIAPLFY